MNTEQIPIIFLTKSGHPPTKKTLESYVPLIAKDARPPTKGAPGKQQLNARFAAGPAMNDPATIVKAMEENPQTLQIAVLTDDKLCQVLCPEKFPEFKKSANENPAETSWQIAMNLLGHEV